MFIVGLPRSRTAWLSVFMSQSKTYFHHEAINGCYSLDEYNQKILNCGDSTTGFTLLNDILKDKKVVIIKKNEEELKKCIEWCNKEFGESKEVILEMNAALNNIKGLVINQSEIDGELKNIWEFLVDDKWCDEYSNIVKFNIQVKSTAIDEIAAKALYETI